MAAAYLYAASLAAKMSPKVLKTVMYGGSAGPMSA